jgi:hypothetical protein
MDLTVAVNKSSVRFKPLTAIASFLHSRSVHCLSHCEKINGSETHILSKIYLTIVRFPNLM